MTPQYWIDIDELDEFDELEANRVGLWRIWA